MKLTAFILLSASMMASASGNTQGISLSERNAPLQKVFKTIEKQTGYTFFFENKLLQKTKKVDVNVNNASLQQVLDIVFKDQPLQYNIVDKTIVVTEKETTSPNEEANLRNEPPPPIDITGKVTDENGNPLAGASVKVKNSSKGTTTNNDGVFVLKGVDNDAVLEISYVGFEVLSINVSNRTSIVTSLKQKPESLGEVIINKGYYTEKQKYSVGNATHVDSKVLEQQPVQNPILALQDRVPGVQITQLTGVSGGGITVRIQGQNSIQSGQDPLYVVDGVPIPSALQNSSNEVFLRYGSPLNYINPNDIESIDVLKDADATAIYGSRAANGAILITTKKGKAGRTKLNINLQQGWGKVARHVDMMNTRQYLDMRYQGIKNDGYTIDRSWDYDLTVWDTTRYTDWQKVLIGGTAKYTNLNANISGGSSTMQYLIGGTFNRMTTVFPGNFDDKKGDIHFNVGGSSNNKKLQIQLSGSYMFDNNHLPHGDLTEQALILAPDAPALYNADGTLNWAPKASGSSTWTNPLSYTLTADFSNITKNLISNVNLSYNLLPGLTIRANMGYNSLLTDIYVPVRQEASPPEYRATSQRGANYVKRNMNGWIIEPQLQYTRKISKGQIEGLLGGSMLENHAEVLALLGTGYSSDLLLKTLTAAQTVSVVASTFSESKFNSLFARLNYTWDAKYIINLTARREGSSKFGDANKLHNFGSVGLGWIFSEEKWMQKNLRFLSYGKLRGSYGTTGNDQIGDFGHLSLYGIVRPDILYQGNLGLQPNKIPNPHLQWEETKKLQGGLDLGFLNDRINLSGTYALNRSSNQLINYIVPSTTGFTNITQNLPALIQNTSWEFLVNTVNLKGKNFQWSSSLNLTIPRNKLISFPGIEKTGYASGDNGVIVGQSLGVIKAYQYAGVNPTTGDYIVYDKSGNTTSRPVAADKTILLSNLTKFYGGMQQSVSYKGFQLDVSFQFVRQRGSKDFYYYNGYNPFYLPGFYPGKGMSNQPARLVNHWQKPGDNTEFAKYTSDFFRVHMLPYNSEVWYSYDASFIRLKNLSLSWKVPASWLQKAKMQDCLIYCRGENLFTITKYTGLDPENRSTTSLPPLRIITVGVQMGL